jgi:hypothetical protein
MEGERVVFTHEIEPAHAVRVVASGEVDGGVLDALTDYVSRQREKFVMVNTATLLNSGFTRLPDHKLWINRERRIAFDYRFIRERDPSWLNHHLNEIVADTDFVFHFAEVPDNILICQKILGEIGLPESRAQVRLRQISG